eukprot:scaffold128626_cov49-Phaeocystis_antarctica.AAC.1
MRTRAENHRLLEIPYWTCEPKQIPVAEHAPHSSALGAADQEDDTRAPPVGRTGVAQGREGGACRAHHGSGGEGDGAERPAGAPGRGTRKLSAGRYRAIPSCPHQRDRQFTVFCLYHVR